MYFLYVYLMQEKKTVSYFTLLLNLVHIFNITFRPFSTVTTCKIIVHQYSITMYIPYSFHIFI